jgi:hypothetical protein
MQTILVIVIVAGAVFYLGMRAYKLWAGKKSQACDKCGVSAIKKV